MRNLLGRAAFIFVDDDFDVDQIVGVANIKIGDIDRLADLVLAEQDPAFRAQVQPGDLLIGAANFGYGHPHYAPMRAMRHLGVAGVIAGSFSPGYWRGEISMGFPQIACSGILAMVTRWDTIEVEWQRGCVINHTSGASRLFQPLTTAEMAMLEAGGLVPYLQRTMETGS